MPVDNTPLSARMALYLRLGTGLVFGLVMAVLSEQFKPETYKWVGVVLITLSLSAFILWVGAGLMRRLSLAVWYGVIAALIAFIAWHQIDSDSAGHSSFVAFLLLGPFAFITHELVSSADVTNRPVAPYETYFDEAWKRGVQLVLSVLFTALMWGILGLGALLMGFIGLKWFGELLIEKYFFIPVTGMALGGAFHLGDVRAKLLSNVRALILGVLSWLLPVLTLIGLIFVGGLMVQGLGLLWATKAATFTLLGACLKFVLLINAAYQKGDGDDAEDRQIGMVLKITVRVACALLLIFAGLAAYSLYLRVDQYGLTPERVVAGLGVVVALMYAIGYGISAVIPKGRWMAGLERVNIVMAFVMAALFFAVMTPIADPRRLSAGDQVHRLTSGMVKPERFDWFLMRHELGYYGTDALKALKASKTAAIAEMARKAETGDVQSPVSDEDAPKPKPDLSKLTIVSPKGAKLPDSFLNSDFRSNDSNVSECLKVAEKVSNCYVIIIDVTGDGGPELLTLEGRRMDVLDNREGRWVPRETNWLSDENAKAFRDGKVTLTPHRYMDIMIGSHVTSYDLEPKIRKPERK